MPNPSEIWKPIPGHAGYEVSDQGRVRSVDRIIGIRCLKGRIIRPARHRYMRVNLGRRKYGSVHQLVMLAFVGEPPPGQEVCHNDNDETNNRLSNLRYDTPTGNHADKVKHGTAPRGERGPRAILTADIVRLIRQSSLSAPALAKTYGVHASTIVKARSRTNWGYLDADH